MKRFYNEVATVLQDHGWQVALDGRGIRTQGGRPQIVPSPVLAEAMAVEWAGQGEKIDTAKFPLRDLADYAIDAVATGREALIEELAAYAQTDTLCYRADPDEALYKRQQQMWEPLLQATEQRFDVRFERISGVIHRPQPPDTVARMHAALAAQDDFTLAALRMLTSLSASLVIALAAIEPGADADALWAAANLEEDWQVELWGGDAEATANRHAHREAFALAIHFAAMARQG